MLAYKLMRKKKGLIYPLFIDKKQPTPMDEWLEAKCIPTKGFAVRKGWHCCFEPKAPHLKIKLANGEQRVWVKVLVRKWESYDRPESQGGTWILAQKIFILCEHEEVK